MTIVQISEIIFRWKIIPFIFNRINTKRRDHDKTEKKLPRQEKNIISEYISSLINIRANVSKGRSIKFRRGPSEFHSVNRETRLRFNERSTDDQK